MSRGAWAPIRRPDTQSTAAFPDLSATRQTRRSRNNSHNPYPRRTDELNARATQWRNAGQARGIVDGVRADAFVPHDVPDLDTDGAYGAQMSSLVVHDHTAPVQGAWAGASSGHSLKGKGRAKDACLELWVQVAAEVHPDKIRENARRAASEAAANAAAVRADAPVSDFYTRQMRELLASPAHLALAWKDCGTLDMLPKGIPGIMDALDEGMAVVAAAKARAREMCPPHALCGFKTPRTVPLAYWGAAAIDALRQAPDARRISRLAGVLSSDEWRTAAAAAGPQGALNAARCFKSAISSTDVLAHRPILDVLTGYAANALPGDSLSIPVDTADALADYAAWVRGVTDASLFEYPFLLSLPIKAHIIAWEGYTAQRHAERASWAPRCSSKMRAEEEAYVPGAGSSSGSITLNVRRSHIIQDSMPLIHADDLHVPLHITFVGEDAQDVGGVRKEWLLLLCEALEDPNAGIFVDVGTLDEPEMNGVLWFSNGREVDRAELLGTVLGLALFNRLTVPLHVAAPLYKLLLWYAHGAVSPLSLDDLRLLKPALCRGLDAMLAHDGVAFEDSFHVTWSVSTPRGQESLVPGGSERLVTHATREAYIARLVRHVLVDSPGETLAALYRGFARVVVPPSERSPLSILSPAELGMLICGREEPLDIAALRDAAVHIGYSSRSPARVLANVDDFWAVWAALAPQEQHTLLAYICGSPRVPALGPQALGLRIHHVDGPVLGMHDALPTSSTCTSTLFLPTYASRQVLEGRLRVALANSRGFGLV